MRTVYGKKDAQTLLENSDRQLLGRIVALFGRLVEPELEPIGRYSNMTTEDVWAMLVGQVCVMGSARGIERLARDHPRYTEFGKAVSLETVTRQQHPDSYLVEILHCFSATRFPKRGAETLATALRLPGVFKDGELVLFQGLSHRDDANHTRDELMARCPIFHLKSTSDFMISVGLSHDVIALDTRVIGILREYLHYDLSPERIQTTPRFYLSLEAALRQFCRDQNISLALLDRLIFRFSSMRAIELAVKYPGLTWNSERDYAHPKAQELE